MSDDLDHMRRIAGAAIAYLHACRGHGRRHPAGERAVLLEMVAAMADQPTDEPEDLP